MASASIISTGRKSTGKKKPIEPRDPKYKNSIVTIPNLICFARVAGSIVLVALAYFNLPYWFVGLFASLSLSDWIDGRLARWLKQRSDFGARLDSFADSVLYAALLIGSVLLCWDVLRHEMLWIALGIGSYFLTTAVGFIKFGRIPSYHTYAAKKTQWLVLFAGVGMILALPGAVWLLRLTMIALTLTNIEATLISVVLSEWKADVLSLFHVWPETSETRE